MFFSLSSLISHLLGIRVRRSNCAWDCVGVWVCDLQCGVCVRGCVRICVCDADSVPVSDSVSASVCMPVCVWQRYLGATQRRLPKFIFLLSFSISLLQRKLTPPRKNTTNIRKTCNAIFFWKTHRCIFWDWDQPISDSEWETHTKGKAHEFRFGCFEHSEGASLDRGAHSPSYAVLARTRFPCLPGRGGTGLSSSLIDSSCQNMMTLEAVCSKSTKKPHTQTQ